MAYQINNAFSGNSNPYGLDAGSENYAQDAYAAMSRDQWQQYLSTFVPIENQLIQYAMDPDTASKAVDTARTDVSQQFDAQAGMQQRRLKGYGISLDADQQQAATREQGIQRSLADVAAVNNTRDAVKNRQMSIMGGPPMPQAQ